MSPDFEIRPGAKKGHLFRQVPFPPPAPNQSACADKFGDEVQKPHLRVVVEKPRAIFLGVGKHDGVRRLPIPPLVIEQEDRQGPSFDVLPLNPDDRSPLELGIVLPLDSRLRGWSIISLFGKT